MEKGRGSRESREGRVCFWCFKEFIPVRRRQGGGRRQAYCSSRCRQASHRELNLYRRRTYHRKYMRARRANERSERQGDNLRGNTV
jgi:hypothetical protein